MVWIRRLRKTERADQPRPGPWTQRRAASLHPAAASQDEVQRGHGRHRQLAGCPWAEPQPEGRSRAAVTGQPTRSGPWAGLQKPGHSRPQANPRCVHSTPPQPALHLEGRQKGQRPFLNILPALEGPPLILAPCPQSHHLPAPAPGARGLPGRGQEPTCQKRPLRGFSTRLLPRIRARKSRSPRLLIWTLSWSLANKCEVTCSHLTT